MNELSKAMTVSAACVVSSFLAATLLIGVITGDSIITGPSVDAPGALLFAADESASEFRIETAR